MPNWCSNSLQIRGNKEDVFSLFQKIGFKGKTTQELQDYCDNTEITLRSWYSMPQTFIDWDTTNDPRYPDEEYLQGYKEAKKYQQKHYGCVGWYDYNMKTLGVKWDAELYTWDINEHENELIVDSEVDTPWSYPDEWFKSMVKDNPKLEFELKYDEPGENLYGRLRGMEGKLY